MAKSAPLAPPNANIATKAAIIRADQRTARRYITAPFDHYTEWRQLRLMDATTGNERQA
jgi:hypothetical protein